jgi:hypothetical protein
MTVTYPIVGSFSIGAGEPFTVDDLFALPDNGNRHEIFDGSLVMSPPPATGHIHVTPLTVQSQTTATSCRRGWESMRLSVITTSPTFS